LTGNIHHRLVIFYAPLVSGTSGLDWFQGAEGPGWTECEGYVPVSAEMIGRDLMVVYDRESVVGYLDQISSE
jgi:hypothetical protein